LHQGQAQQHSQGSLCPGQLLQAGVLSTSNFRSDCTLLSQVPWRQIILDEAHCIKDRRCSTAKAVFAVDSRFKWALSGTPLQNRVGELYSLIRFLRIFPYAYYFCNKKGEECSCKSLDYLFRLNHRKCDECG